MTVDKPIRVASLSHYSPDPALDIDSMTGKTEDDSSFYFKYALTRDEKYLIVNEGKKPIWFYLKRLSAAYVSCVLNNIPTEAGQRYTALKASIVMVEDENNGDMILSPPKSEGKFEYINSEYGSTIAPESFMQELVDRYGSDCLQEIGNVALTMTRLPKAAKGPFGYWGTMAQKS